MAKSADQWLKMYAVTHRNPLNKKIHMVCVPAIFWTVVALTWCLPVPSFVQQIYGLNWATLLTGVVLVFYGTLGLRHFAGMLIIAGIALSITSALESLIGPVNLAILAGAVFVVAWIGQFYGHKVEGKKPAFFEDILFLLIGPLWIIEHITKKIRI